MEKPINLSWLVEKWTLLDEDSYLKNIWINTESLDIIRINQGETTEDIMENYIDIDNDIENYVLMPGRDSIDESRIQEAFMETLPRHDRDEVIEDIDGYSPNEEFMDKIYSLGLESQYNEFRKKVAGEILLYWADEEKIPVRKDMEIININKI